MTVTIHPTAIVDSGAELEDGVEIGPYCAVGAHVKLGSGVVLKSHVAIDGHTSIGSGTVIYPFASIGHVPQDLKFKGEPSELTIGSNNVIREHVTMNPGTEGGGMLTSVGNNGLFMVGIHVAHDCHVGNNVIMANNATLAGHVSVGDNAVLGGLSAVHQFVNIGHYAMIGGMTGVANDIIPYGQVWGGKAYLVGLNLVGLKRAGFPRSTINSLRSAYRLLFAAEGTMAERIEDVAQRFQDEPVEQIITFLKKNSSRGVCQPKGVSN